MYRWHSVHGGERENRERVDEKVIVLATVGRRGLNESLKCRNNETEPGRSRSVFPWDHMIQDPEGGERWVGNVVSQQWKSYYLCGGHAFWTLHAPPASAEDKYLDALESCIYQRTAFVEPVAYTRLFAFFLYRLQWKGSSWNISSWHILLTRGHSVAPPSFKLQTQMLFKAIYQSTLHSEYKPLCPGSPAGIWFSPEDPSRISYAFYSFCFENWLWRQMFHSSMPCPYFSLITTDMVSCPDGVEKQTLRGSKREDSDGRGGRAGLAGQTRQEGNRGVKLYDRW